MVGTVEERRQAIGDRHPSWRELTVDRYLSEVAGAHPERPWVITDDVTLTYGEVEDRAEAYARGLAALGVRAGDRVALVLANRPEFVPLLLGIWRLGAAAIPVNFLLRTDELAYVIGQSACRVVVTMGSFRGLDYVAAFDQFAPGWRSGAVDAFGELAAVVVLDGAPDGVADLDELVRRGRERGGALPPSPAGPHDPAIVMYTSGTTGLPKGVIQTHDNLLRMAYATAHHRAFEDGRRVLFALPLYHAFALLEGLLAVTVVAGAVIPQPVFDPGATLAGIARHRANDLLLVPTMSVALLEHPDLDTFDLSSLHAVLAGAAPTPVWVWQQLQERLGVREVFTGYGMTELTCATTETAPGDPLGVVAETVGRPKDGGVAGIAALGGAIAEYRTVDPFTGAFLPDGAEGELVARGPTATCGYFDKPEETAALLLEGGWVRSGDLGLVRPDGYLQLTGRSKELYKSGGELVSPKEIEELLTAHPAIGQAFAVGLPDDRWGEIGCACLVLSPGGAVSEDEVLELCRAKLARFKVPRHVLFFDAAELPATPTGKVQKFRLVELARRRLGRA